MASFEPSEEGISQVIDFAGLDAVDDRRMVVHALKNNGGNVETVVTQYFEDSTSFRKKYSVLWDDRMFGADRDGSNNSAGISFHIETPGPNDIVQGATPPPEGYGAGAPSRPPSRTNSRSPLGRMVEWTAGDASNSSSPLDRMVEWNGGNATGLPNSQAQEDEFMQRALRESAQEAGISVSEQETGIMDPSTSTPYFGPANRSDYEQGSWAMVSTGVRLPQTDGVPAPSLRKRLEGVPAFLIQGASPAGDHRLGSLLTILHEIPLARNTLLGVGSPSLSYGHNNEWWKGEEILAPHVLARVQSGELNWDDRHDSSPHFEEEIHRLMAFLDSTDRSYGTVSALAGLIPWPSHGAEKQFFEQLSERNTDQVQPLYHTAAFIKIQDDGDTEGDDTSRFHLLETEHVKGDYEFITTLYESLDHLFWGDVLSWSEIHDNSRMAVLRQTGEVITIKAVGEGPDSSIDIPEVLYPERWLESRKEEAVRIQKGWEATKNAMKALDSAQKNVYEGQDPSSGQPFDKRERLMKAAEQWRSYQAYLESSVRFRVMKEANYDTDKYPDYRAAPCQMTDSEQKIYQRLQDVIDFTEDQLTQMSDKLTQFREQMERTKAKQRLLGKLLTDPDKPGRPEPLSGKKWLLRGVATSTDVVYVCRRREQDLIELEGAEPSDQWWKLAYVPSDEQPVKAEMLAFQDVLRQMWKDTKNPTLVYATEAALETTPMPMSSPLERFVKAENKAFSQELNQETAVVDKDWPTEALDPISPTKRKHRSDSLDSMASNQASVGSDGMNRFDDPFEKQGVEMTPISGQVPEPWDDDSAMDFGEEAQPPPLPKRHAAVTETNVVEATENSREPEMQERARPPPFMSLPQGDADKLAKGMDMDTGAQGS